MATIPDQSVAEVGRNPGISLPLSLCAPNFAPLSPDSVCLRQVVLELRARIDEYAAQMAAPLVAPAEEAAWTEAAVKAGCLVPWH